MSFPRYPKYKDSGIDWLGNVPEHWNVMRLGFLCEKIGSGKTPSGGSETYVDEGVLFVRSQNVYDEGLVLEDVAYIPPETDEEMRGSRLAGGDILLNITGASLGRSCLVPSEFGGGNVNQHVCIIRLYDSQPRHFVSLFLKSRGLKAQIDATQNGAAREGLNYSQISKLSLCLPPEPEQAAIASFLNRETAKIDGLVGEQRRLIELLKEKRQAVISHAVTKGLNPHAPMKPSGIEWLGDVPTAWTVTKLGRAAFMQEGPGLRHWQFTDEGTRVICVTNITENGIDFSRLEKFISTDEYNSGYRHFTVQNGDILLSSSGNSWGKVAIHEGDERVILNTSTIRLNESEGSPLIRDFIALLLQSDTVREQLGLAMTGSCQPNFGPTHLNSVMVAMPSRREQSEIVLFVTREIAALDAFTTEAERAIDLLQERRTALISAAVTGKIDVRGLAESEAA